ncbi:conserved hypothetical protein, partial [delta proteobacterium NaphS2]
MNLFHRHVRRVLYGFRNGLGFLTIERHQLSQS